MDAITPTSPPLVGGAVLSQRWSNLVFLHWRCDSEDIAPLLPSGITPDEFDGTTWVGLIPFEMSQTRLGPGPVIPYFGTFTEVNVRLYGVDRQGRRGVVFSSLEASRLAAVLAARVGVGLPYFWAKASARRDDDVLEYLSRRHSRAAPATRIQVRSTSEEITDDPLADFLTARWLLFQRRGAATKLMPNEHDRWTLRRAELLGLDDGLVAAAGIRSIGSRAPDSVLFSPGVTTRFGRPRAAG